MASLVALSALVLPVHGVQDAVGAPVTKVPDDSAARARRDDFDARGRIGCAQVRGQAMGECDAAVARGSGGDAAVVVTFPNGFRRTLFFVRGEFVSANATMSGNGTDTDRRLEGELHLIRVEDQRYALSDALLRGE